MQNLSIQVAKVAEVEEAYVTSVRAGNVRDAEFWNRELIYCLLVLSDSLRDSEATRRADGREQ